MMPVLKRMGISARCLASVLILGLTFVCPSAYAQTLESLQQQGRLSIITRIVPAENIIAMQQTELQIEVATDRWFGGGTRIGRFEIKDAIVLQREKFAVNSTRVEQGVTWTVQTWSITIFPQRAGEFEIPAIPLTVTVAGENLSKISGQLSTAPMMFSATIPDDLQGKAHWVASPAYSVKESFNRPLDVFSPGDALIRTVKLSAQNTPAMMLPNISSIEVEGISIYQKPPTLSDKVNRGEYLAERTEVITYVFESTGEYELPGETFYWWDLKSQRLQEITLPAHSLQVGPGATGDTNKTTQDVTENVDKEVGAQLNMRQKMALLLGLLLLLVLLILLRRRKQQSEQSGDSLNEHQLHQAFKHACHRQDTGVAIALLYQYLDRFAAGRFTGEIRPLLGDEQFKAEKQAFEAVMASTYSVNLAKDPELCDFAEKFIRRLKQPEHERKWLAPIALKLN